MCPEFFFGLFCPVALPQKTFTREWSKKQQIWFDMTYLQGYKNWARGSKREETEEHGKLNPLVYKDF